MPALPLIDLLVALLALGAGAWLTLYGAVALVALGTDIGPLALRQSVAALWFGLILFVFGSLALLGMTA